MNGLDIGIVVTLVIYGLGQIGGGVAILSRLKAKSEATDSKLEKLEVGLAALDAKIDNKLTLMRSEFHGDLSALRSEMTTLAVEVGKTVGRQDAKG